LFILKSICKRTLEKTFQIAQSTFLMKKNLKSLQEKKMNKLTKSINIKSAIKLTKPKK